MSKLDDIARAALKAPKGSAGVRGESESASMSNEDQKAMYRLRRLCMGGVRRFRQEEVMTHEQAMRFQRFGMLKRSRAFGHTYITVTPFGLWAVGGA
jgi:hypothetical protein